MKPLHATLLLAAALSGCASPENDRMTLGQSVRLETFSPAAPPPQSEADAAAAQVATRSITGMSRSNWAMTPILVPVDGVYHRQTYAKRLSGTDSTRRQRREFPTANSALELTEGSEEDQQGEAVVNVLLAASDVILLIPRALVDWPLKQRISPDEAYERYWRPERWELEPPQPPAPTRVTP